MNTIVNTSSRRKSIAEYDAILNKRKEQQTQKAIIEEERRNRTHDEMEAESQKNINVLCNAIQRFYMMMAKEGQELKQCQVKLENELPKKMKEAELFYATIDEVYPYKKMDESLSRKMELRRFAYYTLPILDCFFAYFALYPIVTSKIVNLSPVLSGTAEIIGAIFSIIVGLGVSLISRLGISTIEDNDCWDVMKWVKIVAIVGAVFSLPLMYIISEIAFNGGEQWTYSGCFAGISLTIQLLVVSGYKRQIEALSYFRERKQNETIRRIKEADENALCQELNTIQNSTQKIVSSFNQEYANFTESFRNLAAARDEHIRKFGRDAKYYLNQLVTYFGDLVCFNHDVIPLYYHANGTVSTIPFGDFPRVYGGQGIFTFNDYINLDYIMQKAHTGISLSEVIRELKFHHNETNTSYSKGIDTSYSLLQVTKRDFENNEENAISTTEYDDFNYSEDDTDSYVENNNQDVKNDVSPNHSRFKSIIDFAKRMFEEEDDEV